MHKRFRYWIGALLTTIAVILFGIKQPFIEPIFQDLIPNTTNNTSVNKNNTKPTTSFNIEANLAKQFPNQKIVYTNGIYELNNNKTNLNANVQSMPYVNNSLDKQNRPSTANALLTKQSRQYESRDKTTNPDDSWFPLGWHQTKTTDKYHYAVNKGHIVAYSLAGNIKSWDASTSNPKNIVTQTARSNQSTADNDRGQNYYETIVRKALDQNKTVRYRVTPLYQTNLDIVPYAIHLEAKSKDNSIEFNIIVPNTQESFNIDYKTGKITLK